MVKKYFIYFILVFTACGKKDDFKVENYIDGEFKTTLLEMTFPYLAKLEHGVNYENRFDTINKSYFIERQKMHQFSFERYFITKDSVHYFLIWKVAPSRFVKKIAIGGRYKVDANGLFYDFEEIFNTPKMELDELKTKGDMLFAYMVEHGNVDAYLGDFLVVEFPDGNCMYGKGQSKWIIVNKPRWNGLLYKSN